jgi:Domain of unknown function (DUF4190)
MTNQPAPGDDATHQPPSDIPPHGPGMPPPPVPPEFQQPASGHPGFNQDQPAAGEPDGNPYGDPYSQPGPYGQPPSPYNQAQPGPYGNAYGQPSYYGMPPAPKGLSIASLCCGIAVFVGFGFFILPQIAAVVLGHLGLSREPAGRGLAIAGLVLGYIGIALTVIVILVFVLAVANARQNGYAY